MRLTVDVQRIVGHCDGIATTMLLEVCSIFLDVLVKEMLGDR